MFFTEDLNQNIFQKSYNAIINKQINQLKIGKRSE